MGVTSPFTVYWTLVGLPVSRAKGWAVDALPFSVVEAAVWFGAASTLIFAAGFLPRAGGLLRLPGGRRAAFFAGPFFLLALACGQGAFPFSLAPTAWRQPLAERFASRPLSQDAFRAQAAAKAAALSRLFPRTSHYTLGEAEVLVACDTALDRILHRLELPPGRRVRRVKSMGPATTFLGLVYGGPAFHDPFFGELAMVDGADLPMPHHWRLLAACHETAHAKGFTREMDAEILTYLALVRQSDPRYHVLAGIHFLRKSGEEVKWPQALLDEAEKVGRARHATEKRQPLVRLGKRLAGRLNLRNDPGKYGHRAAEEPWDPRHSFFATVDGLARRLGVHSIHAGR